MGNGLWLRSSRLSSPLLNGFNETLHGPRPVATCSMTSLEKSSLRVVRILDAYSFDNGTILNRFMFIDFYLAKFSQETDRGEGNTDTQDPGTKKSLWFLQFGSCDLFYG